MRFAVLKTLTRKKNEYSLLRGSGTMKTPQILRPVIFGLIVAALQVVMVLAFAWPSANLAPRDVPLVVAGPEPAATEVADQIDQEHPGAFSITQVADEAAAREALTGRSAYGAIVVTPKGRPRVLVASAASPLLAQQLGQVAQRPAGAPPTDVVAADVHDPRGAGFGAMVLPLIMSAISAALIMTLLVRAPGHRLVGLLTFAVAGGFGSIGIAQGFMQLLPGSYLVLADIAALGSFAVAATVAGLAAIIGRSGLGIGSLTFLLLGNPLSGATSAPELLPKPWGQIGQLLPPGAVATLMRSAAFFSGARSTDPLAVLQVWASAGTLLIVVAALRARSIGVDRTSLVEEVEEAAELAAEIGAEATPTAASPRHSVRAR